jgi:hypothetical protein
MKKTLLIFLTMLSINVNASCHIYIQYESFFKENERSVAFEVLGNHLNNIGHTIVSTLNKADAILKISFTPVLENETFIYLTNLKYLDSSGTFTSFSGRGILFTDSLKTALSSMEKCQ